ncbi:hypothetical protein [Vibrio phage VCPH]|nr:hypothetical protein [Vibrio phage VCPH]
MILVEIDELNEETFSSPWSAYGFVVENDYWYAKIYGVQPDNELVPLDLDELRELAYEEE